MGALLPGFLWPIILICLVLSLYLVYLRLIPYVHMHLSTKIYSSEEIQGYLIITPLLSSSWESLLDFKNEEYVVSYLPSGQGPSSSFNYPAVRGRTLTEIAHPGQAP